MGQEFNNLSSVGCCTSRKHLLKQWITFTVLSWVSNSSNEDFSMFTSGKASSISKRLFSTESFCVVKSSQCFLMLLNVSFLFSNELTNACHLCLTFSDIFDITVLLDMHETFSSSWALSWTSVTSRCNGSHFLDRSCTRKHYIKCRG